MNEMHAPSPPSDAINGGWLDALKMKNDPELPLESSSKDPPELRAARYLKIRATNGNAAAARAEPIVAKAVALQAEPGRLRRLKRLVLAGFRNLEIAERVGLLPAVASMWTALFFDLRRFPASQFDRTDWLERQVFAPEEAAGFPEEASKMVLAYVGGQDGADAIQYFEPFEDGSTTLLPYGEAQRLSRQARELDMRWGDLSENFDHTLGSEAFLDACMPLQQIAREHDRAVAALQRRIRAAVRQHRDRGWITAGWAWLDEQRGRR